MHFEDGELVIDHMYIERRMTPLNLYIRNASREDAERAVLDYGQCIRDLAVTNIFAGDLLLKNFGVTRHGRVIFYDYDELCAVTDCRFRDMPQAQHDEDEMRAEAWFHVNENDVFPETFMQFLGFDEHLKEVFLKVHGEIMTADWWRGIQQRADGRRRAGSAAVSPAPRAGVQQRVRLVLRKPETEPLRTSSSRLERFTSRRLVVVLLFVDFLALLVELLVQVLALVPRQRAVRLVRLLELANVATLGAQFLRFVVRQLA